MNLSIYIFLLLYFLVCDFQSYLWISMYELIKLQYINNNIIFITGIDAEAVVTILWPPDMKNLIGKDSDAGKDWRQEEKGTTEDEMVGWHHWLNGHEFEQASGVGEGQGSLACCSPWDSKESDTTERLNNNNNNNRESYTNLISVFFFFLINMKYPIHILVVSCCHALK